MFKLGLVVSSWIYFVLNYVCRPGSSLLILKTTSSHRATEIGLGNDAVSRCLCICALNSPVQLVTDEGFACLLQQSFLLLGLEVTHYNSFRSTNLFLLKCKDLSSVITYTPHIEGLMQDCSNSSGQAMELLQSCAKPSMWLYPEAPLYLNFLLFCLFLEFFEWIIKWLYVFHSMCCYLDIILFWSSHEYMSMGAVKCQWRMNWNCFNKLCIYMYCFEKINTLYVNHGYQHLMLMSCSWNDRSRSTVWKT